MGHIAIFPGVMGVDAGLEFIVELAENLAVLRFGWGAVSARRHDEFGVVRLGNFEYRIQHTGGGVGRVASLTIKIIFRPDAIKSLMFFEFSGFSMAFRRVSSSLPTGTGFPRTIPASRASVILTAILPSP